MLTLRRVPRAGTRASAALTTAESLTALALAHTAAGGELPSIPGLIPIAVTVYVASRLVLTRRVKMRVMLPGLIAVQLFLHAWLVTLAPAAHPGHGAHAGHGTTASMVDLIGLDAAMVVAHLVAGAATAVAWFVRCRAVEILIAWTDTPALPTPRLAVQRVGSSLPRLVCDLVVQVAPMRGPPVATAPIR